MRRYCKIASLSAPVARRRARLPHSDVRCLVVPKQQTFVSLLGRWTACSGLMHLLQIRSSTYRFRFESKSIPLRGPIPRTSRVFGPSAPGPVTQSTRESSRAGCILFSDGDRSTNGTGLRDISSELQKIRMRYDSVRDIDDEIVSRIAGPPLR
jgi:hypothetical protein